MLSPAVLFAGSRAAMPTWISTDDGASTGTAARGGGSKGERVPRTGWRFVRHLNRLSALAFLRPVRKVSLGAEFPTPFGRQSSVPGFLLRCPVRGERNIPNASSRAWDPDSWRSERARFSFFGRKTVFSPNQAVRSLGSSIWDHTLRSSRFQRIATTARWSSFLAWRANIT